MLSYTGIHVTQTAGAPSIYDMAVTAWRIPRFNGSLQCYWSLGHHLLLVHRIVTELLEKPQLGHFALLHDAEELAGIGDICRPMKTDQQRQLGERLRRRIHKHLGLRVPNHEEEEIVKKADDMACYSEGELVGPRGYIHTQLDWNSNLAVNNYLLEILELAPTANSGWDADGTAVKHLENLLRREVARAKGCPEALVNAA